MIGGDPNQTSTKVRIVAHRVLSESERPLIAHEIERWISENDPDLWEEVSYKCYDYVRMILSLTQNDAIVKYACNATMPGIDRRAVFYGLPGKDYDETFTQITGTRKRRRRGARKRRRRSNAQRATDSHTDYPSKDLNQDHNESDMDGSSNDDFGFFDIPPPSPRESYAPPSLDRSYDDDSTDHFFEIDETEEDHALLDPAAFQLIPGLDDLFVDEQVALESWKSLCAHFQFHDPFWSQFLRALTDARERTREKLTQFEILQMVLKKYTLLQATNIVEQVRNIISREIMITREMDYIASLEIWV